MKALFAVSFTSQTKATILAYLSIPQPHSWIQLILVICLQGTLLVYLVLVKPYLAKSLQLLEVVCHSSEMVVFLGALASLHWTASPAVNYVMLGGFREARYRLCKATSFRVVGGLLSQRVWFAALVLV